MQHPHFHRPHEYLHFQICGARVSLEGSWIGRWDDSEKRTKHKAPKHIPAFIENRRKMQTLQPTLAEPTEDCFTSGVLILSKRTLKDIQQSWERKTISKRPRMSQVAATDTCMDRGKEPPLWHLTKPRGRRGSCYWRQQEPEAERG